VLFNINGMRVEPADTNGITKDGFFQLSIRGDRITVQSTAGTDSYFAVMVLGLPSSPTPALTS
jgi:hypothetical protein